MIHLCNSHNQMNTEQLERSKCVERNIVMLATLKLRMGAREDTPGYKRICKQQMQAAVIGIAILDELSTPTTKTDEQ